MTHQHRLSVYFPRKVLPYVPTRSLYIVNFFLRKSNVFIDTGEFKKKLFKDTKKLKKKNL